MQRLERITSRLAESLPVIGTHIKTTDPTITEFFGLAGMDFIWIDGEHAAMNLEVVQRHVMAAQGTGMAAFYRVPTIDPILVKPVLDMGADGIVFPMVRTAAEAELAVAACRYPPDGIRGAGPIRDNGYGLFDAAWQVENARTVWKIMQIEHIDGVHNLEAICAVEGVDALTVGTSDLSASMGLLWQTQHPDVLAALDELAAIARRAGIPFSISANYDALSMRQWLARGITWLSVGGEYDFMRAGMQAALAEIVPLWNARAAGGPAA
jgi:2-dehydro-3-deoxyglucarate aldolase/4-hydroxy-2-oxoheptanedioate aldolase